MKFTALMVATAANAIKVAHNTPEEDACKCLSSFGEGVTTYFPTNDPDDWHVLVDIPLVGTDIKYPWNYGLGACAVFDEELYGFGCADEDGNILDTAPNFCAEPWCFVSPTCSLYGDLFNSALFDGFVYSYNKCGGDYSGSADDDEEDDHDDEDDQHDEDDHDD